MNCPNCSQALSERGVFCKWCGAPARCTLCKELLEPEAQACVECGTPVGNKQAVDGSGTAGPSGGLQSPTGMPANRNTITFREDRNSRDFEASLTDSSMQSLGGVFGELFATRVGRPQQPTGPNRFFSREQGTLEVPHKLPAPESPGAPEPAAPPPPPAPPVNAELTSIGNIFRPNGETLELVDNRLKATTGMGYVRRLTYLFLYAHELHGRAWTPRDALLAVLKEAKVLDSNARTG